jgi:DNA-binding IclR family transcriptional regulator
MWNQEDDEETAMSMKRVQVIERAIDCAMLLTDGPKTLTEIAEATGLPKGTVFRILTSLTYQGLITKDPIGNRYMPGDGVMRLVQGIMNGNGSLGVLAQPVLTELAEKTDETIALHVRLGVQRLCIAEQPSREALRYTATVGATAPLHVGSAGKVLLAFMSKAERASVLKHLPLVSLTGATITERTTLEAVIDEVRRQGWAMSEGERVPAAAAISVPVLGFNTVAALSMLGPASRVTLERRIELLPDLKAAAAAIGAAQDALPNSIDDGAKR